MKFLLLVALVALVIWFLRNPRRGDAPQGGAQAPRTPPAPQQMVECALCHVHLPRTDALAGPDGQLYCCTEHRQRGA